MSFTRLSIDAPELRLLRAWLDSWCGIGAVPVGMARQGYDLQLTRYAVNAELLRLGYAQVMTIPPNVRHAEWFLKLQREAREAGRGLWAPWTDHLAADLAAFLSEHRRCGELDTGMTGADTARVWVTCSCGARMDRLADTTDRRPPPNTTSI